MMICAGWVLCCVGPSQIVHIVFVDVDRYEYMNEEEKRYVVFNDLYFMCCVKVMSLCLSSHMLYVFVILPPSIPISFTIFKFFF